MKYHESSSERHEFSKRILECNVGMGRHSFIMLEWEIDRQKFAWHRMKRVSKCRYHKTFMSPNSLRFQK
jgi:hypothetical protein